ncbi:MAG: hypothetical protein JOZ38_08350, partial [Candidatus Eremiobacteraeota bacterium]|nr:hypothetical protein [Candidatus Eremiobacteraeota bacterium]
MPAGPGIEAVYAQALGRFQRGQAFTVVASLPATILIAAVLGKYAARELGGIAIAAIVWSAIALPLVQLFHRRFLQPIRRALRSDAASDPATLFARAQRFPRVVFFSYLFAYPVGAVVSVTLGNVATGFSPYENLAAVLVAALIGGTVDGALNFLAAEAFSAKLTGCVAHRFATVAPVSPRSRGGIARRFIVMLLVVIGVTVVTLAGATIHLVTLLASGSVKSAEALRMAYLYAGGAVLVALIFAALATRFLMQSVARPLVRTVELMDRLRAGEVLRREELYSEPLMPHEAGLLVSAFADANAGLERLALGGEQLAAGDLSVEIVPHSERDVVAVAFARVAAAIRDVVQDVVATAQLPEQSSAALATRAEEFARDTQENARDLGSAD